jgi:hypothetical protein
MPDELNLEPDSLVEKVRPNPSEPPAIEQQGFLGRSDRPNYCRLYLSRSLTEYLEIAKADIVHRTVDEDDPDAGSHIWIKPTAMVTRGPPKEVRAADLQTQRATRENAVCSRENAVSCPCPSGERSMMVAGINPMTLFFMGPFMWWAMAAQFCSAAAFMLGGGMAGAARIARSCAAPADRSLCGRDGKIILLGPSDYKVISSAQCP